MRIVVALGGNALLKRGEPLTEQNQRENVKVAARALAPLAREHSLIITHGNGPQVGLLALEAAAYTGVEPYTLDVLSAESEGMIGYMIEQELGNILPEDVPFATILTQVEVDPADPAFQNPTKPIGPQYTREEAERLAREHGWTVGPDNSLYRRLVAFAAAKADLRDQSGRVAGGAGSGGDLHRGRRDPDHADPGRCACRSGGGHRQGPRGRALGRVAGRGSLPDAHRRRGRVGGLGNGGGAGHTDGRRPRRWRSFSSPPVPWAPRWRRPVTSLGPPGGRAGIGALEDAVAIVEGRAGTLVSIEFEGIEYWPSLFHQPE